VKIINSNSDKHLPEPFVLGTAQFGMNYGIANKCGQPDLIVTEAIVRLAWDNGVREFDTAQAYGVSEKVLGAVLKKLGISNFAKVITKPNPELDYSNAKEIEKCINISLSSLGSKSLYCYMLHREELLDLWNKNLREILFSMVENKAIENIGISVYSPSKALEALKTDGINFVQIPSNILDRRFDDEGVFNLAKKMGKNIYIRSVFLQGLVVMDLNNLPKNMSFAKPILYKINKLSSELNITKQELAIAYIKNAYPEAKIILGIDNVEQLLMNLDIFKMEYSAGLVRIVNDSLNCKNERILNPCQWG